MIEEVLGDSSLRVFSVDRDCYVIFVGTDETAQRAFLRIGHSDSLPAAAQHCIEGSVCTSDLIGDIVNEQKWFVSLTPRERPYLAGIPAVLKRYKNFFALKKTLGAKYQLVQRSSSLEDTGVFLYYTDSDQIEVVLDSKCIFSLRKRAAIDFHFSQRNSRIARLISQYNSAYNIFTLPSDGFFVVDSALYIYDHGRIFAVNPPANCYARLAECGFNARMISGGLHTEPDYSFLSLIMNESLKAPPTEWHFYHNDGRTLGQVDVDPFLQFAQKKLSANIITDSLELPFSSFKLVRWMDSEQSADITTSLVHALRFGDNSQCVIDTEKHVWRIVEESASWEGDLIPNIPYSFSFAQSLTYEALVRLYLPHSFSNGTHQLARSETLLLNSCIRFMSSQTAEKLQANYAQLKRATKGIRRSPQLLTLYALRNIDTLLKLQCDECADDTMRLPWLRKALNQIKKTIARLSPLSKYTLYLPAQAVIHLTESGEYVQLIQYSWNRDDRHGLHELGIQQQISDITTGAGEEHYRAERMRFFRLLADLHGQNEEVQSLAKDELDREKKQEEEQRQKEKKLAVRKRVQTRPSRATGAIILITAIAVIIIVVILFSVRNERDPIQSAGESVTQDTPITDTVSPDAIKTQIADSTLDEGSFNSFVNSGATLLADVYLTIQSPLGNVEVTIEEIIRVVNSIARQSGFREIGTEDLAAGDDPDLIYPFNQLSLPPQNKKYSIVENDSLWLVSVSLIESQIKDFISRLVEIDSTIDSGAIDVETERVLRDAINVIVNESYSEALTQIARSIERKL